MSEKPAYPTWIRSSRIRLVWLLAVGPVLVALVVWRLWPPGALAALAALPFAYIAIVLTMSAYRLSPRGDDLQARIHRLLMDAAGQGGRLLDIGCGSGQLLIRFAKEGEGPCVGVDLWPREWGEYSMALAARNAELEGVRGVELVRGTASSLPFPDGTFSRVVSCLTFHEVRDVADRTACLAEALRVLEPGGRFAFIDLFNDPKLYPGRERVAERLGMYGGRVERASPLSDLLPLRWPMRGRRVLGHGVLVAGTREGGDNG